MKISLISVAILSLASWVGYAESVSAQTRRSSKSNANFGVASILQRIDANKNGKLDPSEMSERTKQIVRKAGLNPNQPHMIQTIAQKLEEKNTNSKSDASKNKSGGKSLEAVRKVDGFGMDVEKLGVPDFSPSGEERMTIDAMKRKFGNSTMSQVERTMQRYDTDKNGLIDKNEQKRTRWTNPSADESDTNKDGSLSRLELAYRYKKREEDALKKVKKSKSSSRSSTINRTSSNRSWTSRTRNSSTSTSRGRSTNRRTTTSNSSKKPFNSGSDAYKRYAEGLLKNYDKNKDKKLSKDELNAMRRPPENADTNRDGFVDKDELIASVSNRSNKNKSGKSTSSESKSNDSMDRLRRGSQSGYAKTDSVFGGKDTNQDGQLQMHEFEKKWTKEKISEFKKKDLNGDGVITAAEWKS